MHLGIVSDTHGHLDFTRAAVDLLARQQVDAVLHCGDIGSAEIVSLFAPWPTHFVFGNVDDDPEELRQAIEAAGQTCHGRFGALELAGCRIAFLHGDDQSLFEETLSSQQYDLICFGHTHVCEQRRVGSTTLLNPGALYRANPRSFATVRLPGLSIRQVPVTAKS